MNHMRSSPEANTITIGEVLDAANKHAGKDRTKDEAKEEKGKANISNAGRNNGNNNNNNNNKRSHMDDGSDLVANANTGSGRPRSDGNYRGNNDRGNNNGRNYNGGAWTSMSHRSF